MASSGHSSSANGYTCGTIFIDHSSVFTFIHNQQTTLAEETIHGKLLLEREAVDVGVKIKSYQLSVVSLTLKRSGGIMRSFVKS